MILFYLTIFSCCFCACRSIAEEPTKQEIDEKPDNLPILPILPNLLYDDNKEYFGIRGSCEDIEGDVGVVDNKNGVNSWQDDLNSIDMKMTRLSFAPVLRQLKCKIDPIKSEMKERELKFLMSKGIDRAKIIDFDQDEDSQSDDMCSQIKSKTTHSHDRYTETRSFLQQKQPILIPFANLPPPSNSEEILE